MLLIYFADHFFKSEGNALDQGVDVLRLRLDQMVKLKYAPGGAPLTTISASSSVG